jgi:hypothetical protein
MGKRDGKEKEKEWNRAEVGRLKKGGKGEDGKLKLENCEDGKM